MSEGDRTKMKLRERPETRSSRVLPMLRKVQPEIPTDEGEIEQLRESLGRMGCVGLLNVPWKVREEGLIRDLVGPVINT